MSRLPPRRCSCRWPLGRAPFAHAPRGGSEGGQRASGLDSASSDEGRHCKGGADDKVDERLLRMLAKNFESRDGGGEQWGPVRGEDDDGAEGVVIIDGRKRRQKRVRGRTGAWGGLFD